VVSINSNGVIAVGGSAGVTTNLLTKVSQILTSNGTKTITLDAGTNGQVLTANSSVADGIEWANLPAATSTTPGVVYGTYIETSVSSLYNIGYGPSALNPATSGYQNVAAGNVALSAVTTGDANMAVGADALVTCTTGNYNNAVGPGALQNLTTTNNNIGIGYQSGYVSIGDGNICIGYQAREGVTTTSNNIIIGGLANIGSDTVADSIVLGANAVCSNSNECFLASFDHLNVPSLTTFADGTGTLVQYGGANTGWVQASGGTYNLVKKIDTIISTIQCQLPAEIIFTTTSTDPLDVSWTVPASVNSITIKASGAGAPGTPAIATALPVVDKIKN